MALGEVQNPLNSEKKSTLSTSLKSIKTHVGYCLVLFIQKEHFVVIPPPTLDVFPVQVCVGKVVIEGVIFFRFRSVGGERVGAGEDR